MPVQAGGDPFVYQFGDLQEAVLGMEVEVEKEATEIKKPVFVCILIEQGLVFVNFSGALFHFS